MLKKSLVFIILLMGFGCSSETEPFEIEGLNYYPTEIGYFVSYDVVETVYALQTEPQTTCYQVKERVSEIFKESENGNPATYEVSRFRREDATKNWSLEEVYTFRKDNQRVIRTQDGTPFVILTFPIDAGEIWNGNAFNSLGWQNYEMTDIAQVYTSDNANLVFDKTLTVREAQDSSAVTKNCSRAIYAENVGQIYRIAENYVYCQAADCFGEGIIESGEKMEQQIFEFGIE